jgi:hypothetical protein
MALLRPALVSAVAFLLLAPQAAAGGGWWTFIGANPSPAAPGQRVQVEAAVEFRSDAAAGAAQGSGRYFVYLLRDFEDSAIESAMRHASPPQGWWSLGDAEAIQVAPLTVRLTHPRWNLGKASAAFTMPDLEPGTYDVMLCDAGCTAPLADVIPTKGFTLVADAATAELVTDVDRLEHDLRKQADRLAESRDATEGARAMALGAREEALRLRAEVSSPADDAGTSPLATALGYAGCALGGALIGTLGVFALRRRSKPSPPGPPDWHPTDEELRELASNAPGRSRTSDPRSKNPRL